MVRDRRAASGRIFGISLNVARSLARAEASASSGSGRNARYSRETAMPRWSSRSSEDLERFARRRKRDPFAVECYLEVTEEPNV